MRREVEIFSCIYFKIHNQPFKIQHSLTILIQELALDFALNLPLEGEQKP